MNKYLDIIGLSTAALMISTSAFAADLTMRISLQLPLKSHLVQNLVLFESKVEADSNGSIKVEIDESVQLY